MNPAKPLALTDLAPFVVELVAWLGLEECSPELVGLIRAAPRDVLALERVGLAEAAADVGVCWSLDTIVEHVLVPLGALSLVDGQPMIPGLADVLGRRVLTDPHLGPVQRQMVIRALAENVVMETRLIRESLGFEEC